MLRLFTGFTLPEDLCASLCRLQTGIRGARWIEPEDMHVTLVFIGDVDEGTAEDIHDGLCDIRAPGFQLNVSEIGHFARRDKVHALWAGVERHPALVHLHGKVETALRFAGLEPERRKYTPHITLARLKDVPLDRVGAFIQKRNVFSACAFEVDRFALFRSYLTKGGAHYDVIAEYPLDQPASV